VVVQANKKDVIKQTLSQVLDGGKTGYTRALPRGAWEDRMHFWENSANKNLNQRPDITGLNPSARVGYWGGRLAGDLMGEITRGAWWRYNHPLAITYQVGEKAAEKAGFTYWNEQAKKIKVDPAMAALYGGGLAAAMNVASGNFDVQNLDEGGRPRGYSPIMANMYDPTESNAPLAEPVMGWIVGSRHKMLPWEHFSQERPDVSKQKYEEYKDYQSPMNGTFFGLERTPAPLTGVIGGAIGTALASRNPLIKAGKASRINQLVKGALVGGTIGSLVPSVIDGASNLGLIKGTMSNLDNEPEAQFMGYKVPLSAALTTGGAALAAYGAGRAFNKRPDRSSPFRQARGWEKANGVTWVEDIPEQTARNSQETSIPIRIIGTCRTDLNLFKC
jgi:hypothetical protein